MSLESDARQFIIFERSNGHCGTFLVRGKSLGAAMATYYVRQWDAVLLEDGAIRTDDGYGGQITYGHPLECIESEYKSADGLNGASWEVRELQEVHWTARMSEVFCSADPSDIERYIQLCRPVFQSAFPRSRARAFVWYLKDGPLVTFHRRKNPRRRWPVEIVARYLLPWSAWGEVRSWNGTLDDILDQMALEYPPPATLDSIDVKQKIEQALQPLIGEPLTDMWRYAGNQKFEFGIQRPQKNRKGEDVTWADWSIVVGCEWRITAADVSSISSDDYGPNGERYREEETQPFLEALLTTAPEVESITAEENGAVLLALSHGYTLSTRPCDPPDDRGTEQWRFMPRDDEQSHFVISAGGIEM